MHTRAPSVVRHLWVARANAGPRTYVRTSRPSPTRPTLYSARLERYPLPRASSRTSAPVTHRRSSNPLRFAVASFLFNRISFDPPLFYPFPRSFPIVRRAFFAYPFGAYVTEQIGDGECRTVLAFIPTDVPR